YPIAITRGAFQKQIAVPHYPYCAVLGPDGSIAYSGDTGMEGAALDGALSSSKKAPLWPKSLAKVTSLMMGDPVKAYGELKKLNEAGKVVEADKPYVERFVAFLEGQAKSALTDAQDLSKKG